jgi:hypothetical protein
MNDDKKTSTKGKRVLFVIPEWMHAELLKKAESMNINFSEAVREAIREFIKKP